MSIKYEDRTVIHEGKEYKVLKIIKELGLNEMTYYNQRKKGMTAQDAFLHCLNLKNKIKVKKVSEENQISKTAIYRGVNNNLPSAEIIKKVNEKKEKDFQTLEYLREIGLPLEYNSLTDFCNQERLNMIRVYKGIQKGMNLYKAVQNSLIIDRYVVEKSAKYYGVQLKSIAQKYGLDSNQLNVWLRKGFNYQEAIERELFARIFSALKKSGNRIVYLWKIYQNEFLKGLDFQKKVTDDELQCFMLSYARMEHIKRDLMYYEFLEGVNIPVYKTGSLDERVQDVLLTDPNVTFTLSELYYILDFENGLMKDFTYVEPHHVWVYSGNREVLKKLKKPSN